MRIARGISIAAARTNASIAPLTMLAELPVARKRAATPRVEVEAALVAWVMGGAVLTPAVQRVGHHGHVVGIEGVVLAKREVFQVLGDHIEPFDRDRAGFVLAQVGYLP